MVGIVVVSHSQKLAENIVELSKLMAENASMAPAGGMEDGGFGTSYDKIYQAIDSIDSDDGVIVLMDLGSAVMTTQLVIEDMEDEGRKVQMVDCPIVEGAIAASVSACGGASFEEVIEIATATKGASKFD